MRKHLERLRTRETVTSVMDATGLTAIAAGVGMFSAAAGVITAGIALLILGWVLA